MTGGSIWIGSATVPVALVGVSPTAQSSDEHTFEFLIRPADAIGETPMAATGTVALPAFN